LKELPFATGRTIENARYLLETDYERPPRVLDMFGGGGTIAAEAAALGTQSFSIDANELSVFIQQCNLIYSQEVDTPQIPFLLRQAGDRILQRLKDESEILYPRRAASRFSSDDSVFAYFWSYSAKCADCSGEFLLSKRPWLSKKRQRQVAVDIFHSNSTYKTELDFSGADRLSSSVWIGRNGTVACPHCGVIKGGIKINECRDALLATGSLTKRGKVFSNVVGSAFPDLELIGNMEYEVLEFLNVELPTSRLPRWSGIINPSLYGIETHAEFLNPRQRLVLLLLIKSLKQEYGYLLGSHSEATAKYIVGMLSSLIDQLVDWNCRLSMWIPQNEQVGRAFCGPGISMLWDYAEIDPLLSGPANLWSKLDRIVAGAGSIPLFPHQPNVRKAYAQDLPFEDDFFDAIVTDPPYYDNIYYTALADFFFAWKRLLLKDVAPELFTESATDSSRELVASKFRSLTSEQAHADYCDQLKLAFREAARVLRPDGVFSFVYSHSSIRGWQAVVQAYRDTSLIITSVQPLSIERKARPRAMTSEAVNTCVTFVAHHSEKQRPVFSPSDVEIRLREIGRKMQLELADLGWSSHDIALAIFANGVAMIANTANTRDEDADFMSLRAIRTVVQEFVPTFDVKDRKSI
jgi:putative DNA methylase